MMTLTTIPSEGATIVARFETAELVGVQHANGYVGLYAEDGDDLVMISTNLVRNPTMTGEEIARRMMNLTAITLVSP